MTYVSVKPKCERCDKEIEANEEVELVIKNNSGKITLNKQLNWFYNQAGESRMLFCSHKCLKKYLREQIKDKEKEIGDLKKAMLLNEIGEKKINI